MSPAPPPPRDTALLYRDLHGKDPELVRSAKGSFLELQDGRQILDACAGAAVASIGHGDKRVIDAIVKSLNTLSYHHTSRLTNQSAEDLAKVLVGHKPGGLSHAIFLSSGSEANESALKLARQYFVETGQPSRVNIISRHNSYHGNTIGCVSLTGIRSRRKHFEPMLLKTITQVSPCYPYRYQLPTETTPEYADRLAAELEAEILRLGPETVAAFFAETVGGAAAGNLVAVPGYFEKIRKVCDKYGVLLVLDEIMCGVGRTGKFHAWEWEGVSPDIQTIGKGINGGYQPLSAVLMSQKVVDGLKSGSGSFANGQTYQSLPSAAACGLAVLKIFETDNVLENCTARGKELLDGLTRAIGEHPNVGEIRGRGLFLSLEFVTDKATKGTFPANLPISLMMDDALFSRGVSAYSGFGKSTVDGTVGDHILFSPPLTISNVEVALLVKVVQEAVEDVFSRVEVIKAMKST
ncbi:adenosylmethionine--8-amino-7-oxononanoate transaminase [Meredithblackwellia eburnea MCA 4105]